MDRVSLGQYIREVRRQSGLSAKGLAQAIARSETWLYRVEHGQRAEPLDGDLQAIARACYLNQIERHYLYLLAGRIPPVEKIVDPGIREYLEAFGGPAAWIDGFGSSLYNQRFRGLFRGVGGWQNIVHWLYRSPDAPRIVRNWREIALWWAGVGRLYLALSGNDPTIQAAIDLVRDDNDFHDHWRDRTRLKDPSHALWYVIDSETGAELEIDMRLWTHPTGCGGLLAGLVRVEEFHTATGVRHAPTERV